MSFWLDPDTLGQRARSAEANSTTQLGRGDRIHTKVAPRRIYLLDAFLSPAAETALALTKADLVRARR